MAANFGSRLAAEYHLDLRDKRANRSEKKHFGAETCNDLQKGVHRELSRYEPGGLNRVNRGSETEPRKTTLPTSVSAT